MRKIFLPILVSLMAISLLRAGDLDLGDFEDGQNSWSAWGNVKVVTDNPLSSADNNSLKVLKMTPQADWDAIQLNPIVFSHASYESISFDLYTGKIGDRVTVNVEGAGGFSVSKTTLSEGWNHIVIPIPAGDGTGVSSNIWIATPDFASVYYFDNIAVIEKSSGAPVSINLTSSHSSIIIGKKMQMIVIVDPITAGSSATFLSSDPSVATVDKNGIVTSLMAGTTNITATSKLDQAIMGSVTITVTEPVEENSIVYEDFENGIGHASGIEEGWTSGVAYTPGPKTSVVNNPGKNGNNSVKVLLVDSCYQWASVVVDAADMSPFNKINFKVYSDVAYDDFQFELTLGAGIKVQSGVGLAANTWTEYELSLESALMNDAQFVIRMGAAGSVYNELIPAPAGYKFYIDDITLIAGDGIIPVEPLNLLANEGFEDGLTNWGSWGGTQTINTTTIHSGINSMEFTGEGGLAQTITSGFTPGLDYTVSAWVMTPDGATASTYIGIQFVDGNNVKTTHISSYITNTAAFEEKVVSATVPVGAVSAAIFVYQEGGTTKVIADDFSMTLSDGIVIKNDFIKSDGKLSFSVNYQGSNASEIKTFLFTSNWSNMLASDSTEVSDKTGIVDFLLTPNPLMSVGSTYNLSADLFDNAGVKVKNHIIQITVYKDSIAITSSEFLPNGDLNYTVYYSGNNLEEIKTFFFTINWSKMLASDSVDILSGTGTKEFTLTPDPAVEAGKSYNLSVDLFNIKGEKVKNHILILEKPLGISASVSESFDIYPNPVNSAGTLNIKSQQAGLSSITIIDAVGHVVTAKSFQNSVSLNMSDLNMKSGLYLVKLQNNKTESAYKLIVK